MSNSVGQRKILKFFPNKSSYLKLSISEKFSRCITKYSFFEI